MSIASNASSCFGVQTIYPRSESHLNGVPYGLRIAYIDRAMAYSESCVRLRFSTHNRYASTTRLIASSPTFSQVNFMISS